MDGGAQTTIVEDTVIGYMRGANVIKLCRLDVYYLWMPMNDVNNEPVVLTLRIKPSGVEFNKLAAAYGPDIVQRIQSTLVGHFICMRRVVVTEPNGTKTAYYNLIDLDTVDAATQKALDAQGEG